MKNRKISLLKILSCIGVMVTLVTAPARADEEGACAAFNPAYVLCSTHAHNIGLLSNPDTSQKVEMDEVIALKTTVIAQQLRAQYDSLNAMVRKLKNQLNKAILTDKLNIIAGTSGNTSNDKSSSSSSYTSKFDQAAERIEGAQNCEWEGLDTVYSCWANQMKLIANNARTNTADAKTLFKESISKIEILDYYKADGQTDGKIENHKCSSEASIGTAKNLEEAARNCFSALQTSQAGYNKATKSLK